ncbi:flavodoxin family protein [Sediminitomix flava]|uniref:Multimeric flavodoxin WrbA n=1 Tax=Sediminitomix flava TaxID=379075 RepID=A0A315ZEU2_SEDFL|nr:flavodoxin family protein [Sediminitomix flava]PWJ43680.1 multimeric flavodoxin WrbA [Sediminitomix flava]
MKKGVIILGSSNSKGETSQLVSYINGQTDFDIVDLKTKNIAEFDYEFKNQEDDFLPLIKTIVESYDTILFATPVYWYTMSGIMKTFFDRISDCLKIEKETGRKLRGMNMAVISCGSDHILKEGFHMPFKESANYLGMNYLADVHGWLEDGEIPTTVKQKLGDFVTSLN